MSLLELIQVIKESKSDKKDDYLAVIEAALKTFSVYESIVLTTEIEEIKDIVWTKEKEFKYKNQDIIRSSQHDLCIEYCKEINDQAKELGVDFYINTDNRKDVAVFVGESLNEIYNKGINY